MSMTFYIGKDYRIYEKKYKRISLSFAREMEAKDIKVSKASCFRYMLDKLDDVLNKSKKEGSE